MKTPRLLSLLLPLAALAVLAAGCGGGGGPRSVPADAVAVVGSTPITKSDYNNLISIALARYKAQGQPAPKPGTAAYDQLRAQAVTYLVQEDELRQEAQTMGVTVTQKDVDARLALIRTQYYGGSEKKLEAALKKDGITLSQLEQYNLRPQLLSEKLYAKVTGKVQVSKADAKRYYEQNKTTFTTPAQTTRSVRHILVKSKALAERLEVKLKHGASFAQLAKQYSQDPGTAQQGGNYTAVQGRDDPAFDKAAFSLKTKQISQPVHSQFGWHIIQALGPVKKTPARVQPFSQVEVQIEQNLLQQRKTQVWQDWLAKLAKDFKGKVAFQSGYAPPTTATTPGSSTTPSATG